ncbi:MAG TPA: TIGR03086 family metal-binding protein [Nocardioides sp.]|uniref:TIGR03086 family metal-binding protein n=1 Tax=Nocardioides sp. TaxID=35761 RepID=UPI002CC43630|nr:TIGR03086 family metal-binding protein [Nocardioides sp.]HTW14684.1 TIGR03086 family metal-binding protein [Nocardioides sp.]
MSPTVRPGQHAMEILDLRPACTTLARVVGSIRDDQLAGPTPCPAYTVADLVDHVLGLALAFTAAARKEELAGPADPSGDGTRLPDGWRDLAAERLDALATAWADPAAYDGLTTAGGVELPGGVTALVALDEVVVHGWDLARATGQEYDADPDAVAACLEFAASFEPPADDTGGAADTGLFGPPVPVPDDAPVLDRLVGATGRHPHWVPA